MGVSRLLASSVAIAVVMLAVFGVAYPLAVYAAGHVAFTWQSEGSLLTINGTIVGSELLAQQVNSSKLFHPEHSSGADPYIRLSDALAQVPRISRATGIPQGELYRLVYSNAEEARLYNLYIFGPSYGYVNTAELNYELLKDFPWAYGDGGGA